MIRKLYRNCGGLGQEWCNESTCNDDLLPVNLGGESTICRKPEEAAASGGIVGASGGSDIVDEPDEDDESEEQSDSQYAVPCTLNQRQSLYCTRTEEGGVWAALRRIVQIPSRLTGTSKDSKDTKTKKADIFPSLSCLYIIPSQVLHRTIKS